MKNENLSNQGLEYQKQIHLRFMTVN